MGSEFYNILRNSSKDRTDRYRNCSILEDIDTGEILLSYRESMIVPIRPSDTYHRVKSQERNRLDMIAHDYYKNPLLWWVIAQANDIIDPFAPIATGTLLRVPSIESLYGNNGILL